MSLINLITPKFLKKFDRYLILQYPYIWRTRFHYVLYFSLIGWLVLFLSGLFYPLNMYEVVKEANLIEEIKHSLLLFGLISVVFVVFFWWSRVARHKALNTIWYQNIIECLLYFICLFTLWQTVNAFNNGIDVNIAYRIENNLSKEDLEKLNKNNFFIPAHLDHFSDKIRYSPYYDTLGNDKNSYYKNGEILLSKLQNKINSDDISRDSQYLINSTKRSPEYKQSFFNLDNIDNSMYSYIYSNYDFFIDSVKINNIKYKNIHKRDSIYLLLDKKDRLIADSILSESFHKLLIDTKKDQSAN